MNYLTMLDSASLDILDEEDAPQHLSPRNGSIRRRASTHKSSESYDTQNLEQLILNSAAEFEQTLAAFQSARKIPGASKDVVAKLPRARVLPMHKEKFDHDESACSICCHRLIDGIQLTRLPCGHIYHTSCVTNWITKSCTCPECRYMILSGDKSYDAASRKRMEGRKTASCSCHPSGMHTCFFVDPNKKLTEQVQPKECTERSTRSEDCTSLSLTQLVI